MKKFLVVCLLCLLGSATLLAQEIPHPTELPGQVFQVKTIWPIDGGGDWDFIKVDPAYRRLYIAHGNVVQAVDLETGLVTGTIRTLSARGMKNARAIALDDREEFGYISDGAGNEVLAFDRRTLKVVARIPTGANPRALVYEPISGLIFAVCEQVLPATANPPNRATPPDPGAAPVIYPPGSYSEQQAEPYYVQTKKGKVIRNPQSIRRSDPRDPPAESVIAIIDAETWTPRATLILRGRAGFAQSDGQGRVFINIVDQNAAVRLEAQGIQDLLGEERPIAAKDLKYGKNIYTSIADGAADALSFSSPEYFQKALANNLPVNWRNISPESRPPGDLYRIFPLGTECSEPQGLSIDGPHLRLFIACSDNKLAVVNADTGQLVTRTPTGFGTGVIEFDSARGLIYAANGDGGGTLTIIHRHVTDSYDVVANLPTTRRARVLAVNPVSGEVYVVTDSGKSGLSVLVVDH
jgi:DNA-binding beta-propeller fold protein YncE